MSLFLNKQMLFDILAWDLEAVHNFISSGQFAFAPPRGFGFVELWQAELRGSDVLKILGNGESLLKSKWLFLVPLIGGR